MDNKNINSIFAAEFINDDHDRYNHNNRNYLYYNNSTLHIMESIIKNNIVYRQNNIINGMFNLKIS